MYNNVENVHVCNRVHKLAGNSILEDKQLYKKLMNLKVFLWDVHYNFFSPEVFVRMMEGSPLQDLS